MLKQPVLPWFMSYMEEHEPHSMLYADVLPKNAMISLTPDWSWLLCVDNSVRTGLPGTLVMPTINCTIRLYRLYFAQKRGR